jgi:prepilin-type N-terminal cleavage/methylation domain-containing protein
MNNACPDAARSRQLGFTMIEMMIALAIFSVVMLMLLTLSLSMGSAARLQDAKITTQDDARNGMMVLTRNVRQASRTSINWGALPNSTISYQVAMDNDANGFAVDSNNDLEVGPVITVGIDNADLNNDGETTSQLVWSDGARVDVLVNGLMDTTEDANGNNVLDAGEDTNGNGDLDQGLLVQTIGSGVLITIQTQRPVDASGTNVTSKFTEFVVPRN